MARYAMVLDINRCVDCKACIAACKTEWNVPEGYSRDWVKSIGPFKEESGDGPIQLLAAVYPGLCMHCDDPPCIEVCPSGATFKTKDGIVVVDQELCVGCGYCADACPYGARYINPELNVVDKCTFCEPRLEAGLEPACVETCISEARIFGDLDDKNSEVYRLVNEEGAVPLHRGDVNYGANVYYMGKEKQMKLLLEKAPLKETKFSAAGSLWRIFRPLLGLAAGASFVGVTVAAVYQLVKGEPKVDE